MKILFWILAILSIPVGLFVSIVCYISQGLDLGGTIIGESMVVLGMPAVIVSSVCIVLGIIKLRKGNTIKAVVLVLAAVVYSGIIMAGYFIDDAVDTVLMEKDIAVRDAQLYGEEWNAAPIIEGIPELYQEVLNKYYAAVRDRWSADQLMDLGTATMAEYYDDASLENIGFILLDVNGDSVNELLIGTTASVEEGGTAIFCMYSDPENPFMNLNSVEGETYYLHSSEADGTCMAEIGGEDAAWLLGMNEGESIVDIIYREGAMDSAGRLSLEMIPFSQYK